MRAYRGAIAPEAFYARVILVASPLLGKARSLIQFLYSSQVMNTKAVSKLRKAEAGVPTPGEYLLTSSLQGGTILK